MRCGAACAGSTCGVESASNFEDFQISVVHYMLRRYNACTVAPPWWHRPSGTALAATPAGRPAFGFGDCMLPADMATEAGASGYGHIGASQIA